jgi:hypothetical protein
LLKRQGRKFCSRHCALQRDIEVRQPIQLARARLAELKASGQDPGHGGEAARKRGAKIAESNRRRTRYLSDEDRRLATNERARRYRDRKRRVAGRSQALSSPKE